MGEVLKARHRALGRVVALKVIRKECVDNPRVLARFQREIEATGKLDHPNVVRAFDADQVGGVHFFAMEYIEGTDLSRLVKERGPLPILQACDYIRQAALGLQHAHERGLIHRDLKPSNLMVTATSRSGTRSSTQLPRPADSAGRWGVVKILDLGLARVLSREARAVSTMLTQVGAVMGTPDFLAPEQARNSRGSDIRADLYSLGCTLYYLLTGRVPFPSGSVTEKLLQHHLDQPEPVGQVRGTYLAEHAPVPLLTEEVSFLDIPESLSALVQRLMAKRPEDRYQTPAELAEALTQLMAEVEANRPSRPRLKPTDATLAGASTSNVPVARPALRHHTAPAEMTLNGQPPSNPSNPTEPLPNSGVPRRGRLTPGGRGKLIFAGLLLVVALSGRLLDRPTPASVPPTPPPPPVGGGQGGAPAAEDGWEKLLARVRQGKSSPDELCRELVAFRAENLGRLSGRRAAELLTLLLSPLDLADPERIPLKDQLTKNRKDLVAMLGDRRPGQKMPALCVAFSPDGKQIVRGGADLLVRRWDTATLGELPPLSGHKTRVQALAWSPDGRWLASGGQDGVVFVWDMAAAGKQQKEIRADPQFPVEALAFAPMVGLPSESLKARRCVWVLATGGSWDGTAKLWDPVTGRLLRTISGDGKSRVLSLAFTPDGALLACGQDDNTVRLWDVAAPGKEPRARYRGNNNWVKVLAFAPDGKTLLSGGWGGGTLRLCVWDGKQFTEGPVLSGSGKVVNAAAFAPDGKTVVSGSADQSVKLWDVPRGAEEKGKAKREWANLGNVVNGIAFAPDGRHVAFASGNGAVYILRLRPPPPADALVKAVRGP
ncbi:MAG: protein kinase [Gemmataceae bacterium]|nr:protein kinase [Gemmataceae bacterium]